MGVVVYFSTLKVVEEISRFQDFSQDGEPENYTRLLSHSLLLKLTLILLL